MNIGGKSKKVKNQNNHLLTYKIPSNASVAIRMAHQEKLNKADMICHLIEVATNLVTQNCTLSNFLLSTKSVSLI